MTLYQLCEIIIALSFFIYIIKKDKKNHPARNKKKNYHVINGSKNIKYTDPNKSCKKKSKNPFRRKQQNNDKTKEYIECCWNEIEKENGIKK